MLLLSLVIFFFRVLLLFHKTSDSYAPIAIREQKKLAKTREEKQLNKAKAITLGVR